MAVGTLTALGLGLAGGMFGGRMLAGGGRGPASGLLQPPALSTAETQDSARRAAEERRRRARQSGGKTVLTSPLGLTSEPGAQPKTLLGT